MWQELHVATADGLGACSGAKTAPLHSWNVRSSATAAGAGGAGSTRSWHAPHIFARSAWAPDINDDASERCAGLPTGSPIRPRIVTSLASRRPLLCVSSTALTLWQK